MVYASNWKLPAAERVFFFLFFSFNSITGRGLALFQYCRIKMIDKVINASCCCIWLRRGICIGHWGGNMTTLTRWGGFALSNKHVSEDLYCRGDNNPLPRSLNFKKNYPLAVDRGSVLIWFWMVQRGKKENKINIWISVWPREEFNSKHRRHSLFELICPPPPSPPPPPPPLPLFLQVESSKVPLIVVVVTQAACTAKTIKKLIQIRTISSTQTAKTNN